MEAKKINIEEWDYIGEGGTAVSYRNKINGKVFLKLNRKGYSAEATFEEYNANRVFRELGVLFPEVYDFVTDGERYGYTGEIINGKMSFARMLSLYPERTDDLCHRLATMSRELHNTQADTKRMNSLGEYLNEALGDFSYVPEDIAVKIKELRAEMSDVATCLHGDLNPGNVISDGRLDYWIGSNLLLYGDPYWDIAAMHVLCYCLPPRVVKEVYHNDVGDLRVFYTSFKRYYFGDSWDSTEVEKRIDHAALIRCCILIRENPDYAATLVPFIRGNRLRFHIEMWLFGIRKQGKK